MTIMLLVSIDVDDFPGQPLSETATAVRATVCDALGKVKLRRKGYKMSFATVMPYTATTPPARPNYEGDAQRDAAATADNFLDEIVEALVDSGKASEDLLNDYPGGDEYHHESHTDKDYDLTEAAEVIRDLRQHVETDKGLWESLEPDRAIIAQAAYTYGNAVYAEFQRLIERINDGYDSLTIDLDDREQTAEERRDRREELEGMDKRTREEYNELRSLRKSAEADTEEAIAAVKAADIRKMVESKIKDFEP
jgi:hypothetical protein